MTKTAPQLGWGAVFVFVELVLGLIFLRSVPRLAGDYLEGGQSIVAIIALLLVFMLFALLLFPYLRVRAIVQKILFTEKGKALHYRHSGNHGSIGG
jgi:hypothetical protein